MYCLIWQLQQHRSRANYIIKLANVITLTVAVHDAYNYAVDHEIYMQLAMCMMSCDSVKQLAKPWSILFGDQQNIEQNIEHNIGRKKNFWKEK